jgi:hypothetical protein
MTTNEKIQAEKDDLFQRRGTFHIDILVLRNHPFAVMALLSKVLITHLTNLILVVGWSMLDIHLTLIRLNWAGRDQSIL